MSLYLLSVALPLPLEPELGVVFSLASDLSAALLELLEPLELLELLDPLEVELDDFERLSVT
jgi:hypothetical protein